MSTLNEDDWVTDPIMFLFYAFARSIFFIDGQTEMNSFRLTECFKFLIFEENMVQ